MFRQLFLFLEGPDDERFCRTVLEPILKEHFQEIKYIHYAKKKPKDVAKFLKSMAYIPGAAFIFLHDLVEHPCFTICKEKIIEKFSQALDQNAIVIAKQEIESWYLAGIDRSHCERLKIKYVKDTEKVNKEKFNNIIPKTFIRTDFMIEILKVFSIEEAKERNNSFLYFHSKYLADTK